MRTAARVALAFILIFGVAVAVPRPASRVFAPDAHAQLPLPTPTLPDILPTSDPLPNPSGDDDDDDDGGSKKPGGGGGKSGGGGSPTSPGGSAGKDTPDPKDLKNKTNKKVRKNKKKKKAKLPIFEGTYIPAGRSFTTNRLVAAEALLRSLGLSDEAVDGKIYPPFIVAGRAAWQNTWGAPRFGPGPIVRQHEGQDVFCNYGDPVLAPESGRVSYSDGGLGGVTARVHTSADDYWYLTHLSETNEIQFPMGSRVEPGDVIGFCGNSGNAVTTPPHVHFGWYRSGKAKDPHRALVRWLRAAEDHVAGVVADTQSKRLAQMDRLTFSRRFGDSFTPSASDLQVVGGSLWASGSSPTGGALSLAEAALQAALSRGDMELSAGLTTSTNRPHTDDGPVTAADLAARMRTAPFLGEEQHNHD